MEVVAEYLMLAQAGKEVVLHYLGDEALGQGYAFQSELEAARFCNICRKLVGFIEESGAEAISSKKASAHKTLLAEIMQEQDLQATEF